MQRNGDDLRTGARFPICSTSLTRLLVVLRKLSNILRDVLPEWHITTNEKLARTL